MALINSDLTIEDIEPFDIVRLEWEVQIGMANELTGEMIKSSIEMLPAGTRLLVIGFESDRWLTCCIMDKKDFQIIGVAVNDIALAIEYRPINDHSRYKRRLL